jgi:hypothetical protein
MLDQKTSVVNRRLFNADKLGPNSDPDRRQKDADSHPEGDGFSPKLGEYKITILKKHTL